MYGPLPNEKMQGDVTKPKSVPQESRPLFAQTDTHWREIDMQFIVCVATYFSDYGVYRDLA
jgi:hypothetical protein